MPAILNSPIEVIHVDAAEFVRIDQRKYDLVIMDIFIEDEIPPAFESETFLLDLKGKLKTGGQGLYNRLYRNSQDKVRTKQFYHGPFKAIFSKRDFKNILGNWIIIGKL